MIWLLRYHFETFRVIHRLFLFAGTKSRKLNVRLVILTGHFLDAGKRILIGRILILIGRILILIGRILILIGRILILKLILFLRILKPTLLLTKPRLLTKPILIMSGIHPLIGIRMINVRQIP